MNQFFPLLLIILCFGEAIYAQDADYIETYPDKIYLSLKASYKNPNLRLRPKGRTLDWQAKYRPNAPNSIGFQFAYKGFGFGLGIPLPISEARKAKFGKTMNFDLNVQVAQPSYLIEASAKFYKGLVDANSPNYPNDTSFDEVYYKRQDLKQLYFKGNFIYLLAPEKYSYRAAFNFMERQKQSAGSPLLIGNISFLNLKGDTSFLAVPIRPAYTDSETLSRLRVTDVGIGGGYAYTFVYEGFTAGAALFLGADLEYNSYALEGQEKVQINAVPLVDVRTSIGYNTEQFFTGISFNTDLNLIRFAEIKGRFMYPLITLRLGVRL